MVLEQKIAHFIEKNHLFSLSDKVLVALSGGADSVALLCVLHALGYRLEAVHCNFHLRGSESDRDEQFCQDLCQRKNIPFHRKDFDTLTYARQQGISVEMAARTLRYDFFETLRQSTEAAVVAVAHHRDDSVETVLLNLVRGTGLKGLRGIPVSNRHIVRPLLGVSREELLSHLESISETYVTDSTNAETLYQRNKIRHEVLPLLRQINPQAMANISRMTQYVSEANLLLERTLEAQREGCIQDGNIHVEFLKRLPAPSLFLHHYLQTYAFSSAQIEQISTSLDAQTGRHWTSPTHELLLDRGWLLLSPLRTDDLDAPIEIPHLGTYVLPDGRSLTLTTHPSAAQSPSRSPLCATMDAGLVRFPLLLRPVQPGDRIRLGGKGGSKLVSDELCSRRVNLFDRRRQRILADADGQVLWLVGIRVSASCYLTSATQQILQAEIHG